MRLIYENTFKGKFPSLNQKFSVTKNGGMFVNKEYKAYVTMLERATRNVEGTDNAVRMEIIVRTYKDIDNMLKGTLDGLKQCYHDDRQITELNVKKIYAKRGTEDTITVRVFDLERSYQDVTQNALCLNNN